MSSRREYERVWRQNNYERFRSIVTRARLKARYGISPEQFEYILMAQHGRCLVCDKFMDFTRVGRGVRTKRHVVVDHDHRTGEVRGLLCNSCNRGLGYFAHNPDVLLRAQRYMKKWKELTPNGDCA